MTGDYEKYFALTIILYFVLWALLWLLLARAGAAGDLIRFELLRRAKTILQTVLWVTLAYLTWKSEAGGLAALFLVIAAACALVVAKPEVLISNERLMSVFRPGSAAHGAAAGAPAEQTAAPDGPP